MRELDIYVFIGCVALILFGVWLSIGCQSATQLEAETAYGAELAACVEAAHTLAESKACRAGVDRKWGVRQDAGPLQDAGGQ